MGATVATVSYLGLEARAVEVQVQLSSGLPAFIIVGLPDKAVLEPRAGAGGAGGDRAGASPRRITVNLSPADLPKEGSHFDVPIALCLLAAIGAADAESLSHYVAVGELSLAHLGVVFLDELPEFQRAVLDSLRQPLETGSVSVARANTHVTFPARVQLVAAMNPCRCGHLGDPALACSRAPRCAADYQAKVSGPLLDRIDLHVEVQGVSAADLTLPPPAEGSEQVAVRVADARAVQSRRYNGHGVRTNAEADGELLDRVATPDEPGRKLLADAAAAMRLSARGFHRVLRVARTIADLAGAEQVGRIHVAEALSYRRQAPRN